MTGRRRWSILSAFAEGADQLIAAEAVKLGATLVAALPLPLDEYRRDFTQKAMTTDAAPRFEELFEKVAASVELPLAAGSTEAGIKAFGPERDRQYREASLFIAKHCHVLIALYDGNDDDVTVGSAAEAVAFCREGIPVAVKGPARPILDGSDTIPVIHIVTPRKAVRTTASEVRVVPWGTKVKGAPGALGKALSGAGLKRPWELSADEARVAGAWTQFRAFTALTTRFNREARTAAKKRETVISRTVSDLFGRNPQAHARGEEVAGLWCRFYGIGETLALEREKRVRADWRDMFLLGFAAFLCFAFYSHLFPVNLLLFDYAAIAVVVGIIFYRSRRFAHRERCFDYRALADALRVGVFWKMLGIGMDPGSGPGALPYYRSMAEAYPIAQQNELAWVKSSLRSLDLTDRIGPPPAAPRVPLDTYDWVREVWVGQQREHYRAVGARYGKLSAWGQRWFIYLMAASVIIAAVFSAIDIRDEMTAERVDHHGLGDGRGGLHHRNLVLPAGGGDELHQPVRRPDLSDRGARHRPPSGARRSDFRLFRADGLQGAVALLRADGLPVRSRVRHAAGGRPGRPQEHHGGRARARRARLCSGGVFRSRRLGHARERRLGRAAPRPRRRLTRRSGTEIGRPTDQGLRATNTSFCGELRVFFPSPREGDAGVYPAAA